MSIQWQFNLISYAIQLNIPDPLNFLTLLDRRTRLGLEKNHINHRLSNFSL